jgi:hypothetical protein
MISGLLKISKFIFGDSKSTKTHTHEKEELCKDCLAKMGDPNETKFPTTELEAIEQGYTFIKKKGNGKVYTKNGVRITV